MSIKMDDYSVSIGMYKVGEDSTGYYLSEKLASNSIIKHYYKLFECVYIRNMPLHIAQDIIKQLEAEIKRRDDEATEFLKGLK